jgi:hypothetical protein
MLKPSLTLSDNSKVKFKPNHRNTFGLNFGLEKDGGTCVGATSGTGGCLDVRTGHKRETCYMAKITQIYKAVGKVLNDNTRLLVGKSYDEMVLVLTNTFQNFVDKNKKEHWFFRLTYSGDVFSDTFAKALVTACNKFPEVKFWLYTRSFQFVPILVRANNLAVYLSIDPVNKQTGLKLYNTLKVEYNNIGLAHLDEPKDIKDIKFVKCPETHGVISNNSDRGACSVCKLCFTYTDKIKLRNITFKLH